MKRANRSIHMSHERVCSLLGGNGNGKGGVEEERRPGEVKGRVSIGGELQGEEPLAKTITQATGTTL